MHLYHHWAHIWIGSYSGFHSQLVKVSNSRGEESQSWPNSFSHIFPLLGSTVPVWWKSMALKAPDSPANSHGLELWHSVGPDSRISQKSSNIIPLLLYWSVKSHSSSHTSTKIPPDSRLLWKGAHWDITNHEYLHVGSLGQRLLRERESFHVYIGAHVCMQVHMCL